MYYDGEKIVLGEWEGYLEFFDINSQEVTQTMKFEEIDYIMDVCCFKPQEYFLASSTGVHKISENKVVEHYF